MTHSSWLDQVMGVICGSSVEVKFSPAASNHILMSKVWNSDPIFYMSVFTCHENLPECIYFIPCRTIPVTAGVTLCWAVLHVPAVDEGQAPAPAPSLLFWVWLLSVDVQGSRSRADEWLLDVHPSWCRCWEWAERVEWCPALLLFTRNDRGISSAAMKPQMRSGYSLNGKDNTS